jgi:hypothetical protein
MTRVLLSTANTWARNGFQQVHLRAIPAVVPSTEASKPASNASKNLPMAYPAYSVQGGVHLVPKPTGVLQTRAWWLR